VVPRQAEPFDLTLTLAAGLVEAIAQRAAEIVLAASDRSARQPEWVTLEEAGCRLGRSAGALRKRAQRGQLPGAVKDGSRWLIDMRVLEDSYRVRSDRENGASAA
jgi:hypothetical protein